MAMARVMLREAEKVMFMRGKMPFGHRSTYTGVVHVMTPKPFNSISNQYHKLKFSSVIQGSC